MHGSIRDRLEELLSGGSPGSKQPYEQHLGNCAQCSGEVASMKEQAGLLHLLRAPEEMEPSVGFYARVMQRIEVRAKESIWAGIIYSPFSKRLAFASLTLAVALSSYFITAETRDGHLMPGEQISATQNYDAAPMAGNPAQQRDAVLVNFAYGNPAYGKGAIQ